METSANSVFINCPFDENYQPFFDAILFTVYFCNFTPRCAKEVDDGTENRIDKIVKIIKESRYAIHDLSRTELNNDDLPRFNMPFELGLFMGARKFGGGPNRHKKALILDIEPHRYQKFILDISGIDVTSHGGEVRSAVRQVRNWLSTQTGDLPSGSFI